MNLNMLRFGAISTSITPTDTGRTILVRATDSDREELRDVFSPRKAVDFNGEDGVSVNISPDGSNFDFKIQDSNGKAHEAQGRRELAGLSKLFARLEAKGDITDQTYVQLVYQLVQRNKGPLILASIPADHQSVMTMLGQDTLPEKP